MVWSLVDDPGSADQGMTRVAVPVGAGVEAVLHAMCEAEQAPHIVAHAAALGVLLARLSGRSEALFTLGHEERSLQVRVDLSSGPTLRGVVRSIIAIVREGTHAAADNDVTSFAPAMGVLVCDDGSRAARHGPSQQLELWVGEAATHLRLRSDVFDRGRGDELSAQLALLLEAMAADPDRRAATISLVTDAARALVPDLATPLDAPPHDPVTLTMSHQAKRAPGSSAMTWRGTTWTFLELEERATALAVHLAARGLDRGDAVVITGTRCPASVVAFLAVWKRGGVIIPISETLPMERRLVMAREGRAAMAIVAAEQAPELEQWSVPVVRIASASGAIVDDEASPAAMTANADDVLAGGARIPAYVFFTSGTTGIPKGVLGTHQGLAHFLRWQRETFEVNASDRAAQLTALSFDVVLRDMLTPLLAGATLCFPDRDATALDPDLLLAWLRDARITLMHSVPSVLESWLSAWKGAPPLEDVRILFMAGEPLSDTLVRECRARFPNARIVNLYGPTETTLAKCAYEVPAHVAPGTQPVGHPMSHTQAIVLTPAGVPCGLGEAGEIVIRTPFRTLGYLGDASGAAGRFRPNPFRSDPDDLVYATGDRGRYRADGAIDILGRVDDQVKINGVRVEPAEVSAAVRAHPDVASSFVGAFVVRGRTALCAYVVPHNGATPTIASLRAFVAGRLPAAMVPSAFVLLARMPLSANGKVDRKALPKPAASNAVAFESPRTPTEELLAEIWAFVLGIELVGRDDDFFELGGQSLLATQAVARVRKTMNVELPLAAVFDHPTIAELASLVDALPRATSSETSLATILRGGPLPLSFAEARLWFLEQLDPGQATYNLPLVLRMRGRLDRPALCRALSTLVARHESLRTRFASDASGPMRMIDPPGGAAELGSCPAMAVEVSTPFDLERGPLFRASLVEVAAEEHLVVLVMHHIVSDGMSLDVLERDLGALYTAFSYGRASPLPALTVDYADFAVWQRARLDVALVEAQLSYWRTHLAGAPATLDLPTDRPRPLVKRHRGGRVAVTFARGTAARVAELARVEGATSYMVLLAAFDVFLCRHARQDDVVVGMPIANRTRPELERVVGFFVNTLAVRARLDGEPTFREVVRRVRQAALGAYEHQDVPFERVVEALNPPRDTSRTPVFQVMFAYEHHGEGSKAGHFEGLEISREADTLQVSKFDLTLLVEECRGEVTGTLQYDSELFEHTTAERLAERFSVLVDAATRTPDTRSTKLPLMTEAERQCVLDLAVGQPLYEVPRATTSARFEAQASRTPDACALRAGGRSMTYAELDSRANRIARLLQSRGVRSGCRVVTLFERSIEMVVACLAAMKAGAAYVPADPVYPAARIAHMVADSAAAAVLTTCALASDAELEGAIRIDDPETAAAIGAFDDDRLAGQATFGDEAYVIFTSGTTGRPKGSVITHEQLGALIEWHVAAFGVTCADRAAQLAGPAFDATVAELWPYLVTGASVAIPDDETRLSADALRDWFIAEGTTSAFVPTPIAEQLVALPWPASGALRFLETAGDRLTKRPVAGLPFTLVNNYGPTECTVCSTSGVVAPEGVVAGFPSIGRPIGGARTYVLDAELEPLPIGVPGQLWVGGAFVGNGYLGKPALTAERFQPDRFSARAGARMYATGDLVRWLPDGEIDFLGRIDQQVKIRGFRIELGEIEAVLGTCDDVREVVVIAREDVPGEKRLVAYVVMTSGIAPDVRALRSALAARLPDFMIPAAFVTLDGLPLTPNGKIDRRALPVPPRAGSAEEYVAPRDAVEQTVAGIFCDVLALGRVGASDDFFALGGHSLRATQVVARIRSILAVDVPVRALFEAPTVSGLAERVRAASGSATAADPLVRVDRSRPLRASFAQARLWFLDQLEPGAATYNVATTLRLEGALDARALERSLQEIILRHEALRTTFIAVDGVPHQVIHPSVKFRLAIEDARSDEAARALVRRESQAPFDLTSGPVIRGSLVRRGPISHLLVLCVHHIATDGWSNDVIVGEIAASYAALSTGRASPLVPAAFDYADFSVWQRSWLKGERLAKQVAFWREQLAGASAALEVPTDRPRPAMKQYRGGSVQVTVGRALAERLDGLCREEGATPFMALLAAYQTVLARWSGQNDIVVGTPIAGRTRHELEGLVGFFVNTLVMRTTFEGDPSFRDVVRRVKRTALGAYSHQDVPFEKLVEELGGARDTSRTPIFQALFVMQNAARATQALGELDVHATDVKAGTSKFDLSLALAERAGGYEGDLEYDAELFDHATAERVASSLTVLLASAVESPDAPALALPIMSERERTTVLRDWNDTARPHDRACAHQLFEAQARRTPGRVAVIADGKPTTYEALDRRANQVAHHLRSLGVRSGTRVGLCATRSLDMVAAVLGILKVGAAYVPLDPTYPAQRLAFMIEDARPATILTERSLLEHLPAGGPAPLVCLDSDAARIAAQPDTQPPVDVDDAATCYVIYTSGSTGRPKGVVMPHRPLVNLIHWQHQSSVQPGGVTLQFTPLSFDVSFQEMFSTWHGGGSLVLIGDDDRRDPHRLIEIMDEHRVERLFLPFVALKNLALAAASGTALPRSLKCVVTAGEQLQISPEISAFFARLDGCALHNHYGPSETHVVTAHHLQGAPQTWPRLPPIGRPIANTTTYILDERCAPVPIGAAGELYLGGACVADGYHARPDLTADRFIPDPFTTERGGRLYKTGDLARWRATGTIDYLGRADGQLKVRGYRVEPGEIEAALSASPRVGAAVVVVRGDAGDRQLVGYVAPVGGATIDAEALKSELRRSLPDYMVPTTFVILDALPMTPSGKVDRKMLPAPELSQSQKEHVAPRDEIEEAVAAIFREVLRLDRVSLHDDFFELGGHSLRATQVVARVRAAFTASITVRALFEAPTVAGLAELVRTRTGSATAESIVAVDRLRPPQASFAQERMWFLAQLDPHAPTYNLPLVLRFRGPFDVDVLVRAIRHLVQRHEGLRTTLREESGALVQVIRGDADIALRIVDAADDAAARTAIRHEAQQPFDLEKGPVVRATVVRTSPLEHVLVLVMHHAVTDGWSIDVLRRELRILYPALREGRAPELPALPIAYADYAAWQRRRLEGPMLAKQLAYWRDQLAGAPSSLELPTDRPRPTFKRHEGSSVRLDLAPGTLRAVADLARGEGATTFMVLLAAVDALLARHAGQDDLVVGTPIANRTQPEVQGLVGFFANTLALRTNLRGDPTFCEVVRRVKLATLGAFDHEDVPFERLVAELNPPRDTSRTPIFQVMFTHHRLMPATKGPSGLDVSVDSSDLQVAKFDLVFSLVERAGELGGSIEYDTSLFDRATAERFAERFRVLLEAALKAPATPLRRLPISTDAERRRVVVEWNATRRAYPRDRCIHELFAEQAGRTPNAVALVMGSRTMTYGELDAASSRVAEGLRAAGVGPEHRVGISTERSMDLIVGLLGILRAGGAYVPLDPSYPAERIALLTSEAAVTVALDGAAALPLPKDVLRMHVAALRAAVPASSHAQSARAHGARSAAYVLFTSGSTGVPKGVSVDHRAVVRLVRDVDWATFAADDVFLAYAPLAFDASTLEIWAPLLNGAKLVIASPGVLGTEELVTTVCANGVTFLWLTAGLFHHMVDHALSSLAGVRQLFAGGDVLSPRHVRRFLRANPRVKLVNGYGPTENTTFTTSYLIRELPEGSAVPIGKPISNTTAYILDSEGSPAPVGVYGELYAGGDGVARGYVRPAMTAEKFVPDAFGDRPGARLYRTGDLARWLPNGEIDFLGRVDHQVKLRGFRIELGEIEEKLVASAGVRDAVALVREDRPGDKRLVAYVVGERGTGVDVDRVSATLRRSLPEYMVPSALIALDALPMTANGKVDRNALPAPDAATAAAAYVAPRTPTEVAVAAIFGELLNLARVGVDDDFFALGGHSLLAVRVVGTIRERVGRAVPVAQLFDRRTVAGVAAAIDGAETLGAPVVTLRSGAGPGAIVFIAPIGGELIGYRELIHLVEGSTTVLGLRPPGVSDGATPLETVEAIAAEHVAKLLESHPGPYVLVGWSFGGIVAFEVGRQLLAAGRRVGEVVVIDGYPADRRVPRRREELLVDYLRDLTATRHDGGFELTARDDIDQIWDDAVDAGHLSAAEVGVLRRSFQVYEANSLAHSLYVPKPSALLVRWLRASATERDVSVDGARAVWAQAAVGGLMEGRLEGDHYSVMRAPVLAEVARVVSAAHAAAAGALFAREQGDDGP